MGDNGDGSSNLLLEPLANTESANINANANTESSANTNTTNNTQSKDNTNAPSTDHVTPLAPPLAAPSVQNNHTKPYSDTLRGESPV